MPMIELPRAKLCELSGLPDSCSDAQLDATLSAALGRPTCATALRQAADDKRADTGA
jgi:hypothetical protein